MYPRVCLFKIYNSHRLLGVYMFVTQPYPKEEYLCTHSLCIDVFRCICTKWIHTLIIYINAYQPILTLINQTNKYFLISLYNKTKFIEIKTIFSSYIRVGFLRAFVRLIKFLYQVRRSNTLKKKTILRSVYIVISWVVLLWIFGTEFWPVYIIQWVEVVSPTEQY